MGVGERDGGNGGVQMGGRGERCACGGSGELQRGFCRIPHPFLPHTHIYIYIYHFKTEIIYLLGVCFGEKCKMIFFF